MASLHPNDSFSWACSDFVTRAKKLLEQGGAKVTELEALIGQAEQFAWGPADVTADTSHLHGRLKEAKQWVAQVISFLSTDCCMLSFDDSQVRVGLKGYDRPRCSIYSLSNTSSVATSTMLVTREWSCR